MVNNKLARQPTKEVRNGGTPPIFFKKKKDNTRKNTKMVSVEFFHCQQGLEGDNASFGGPLKKTSPRAGSGFSHRKCLNPN